MSAIGIFDKLSAVRNSLDYHVRRHSVITSNIANAETPGFRPHDLEFSAQLASAASELKQTDAEHMDLADKSEDGYRYRVEAFEDSTVVPGNDGNSVSLEREMSKLSANSIRYQAAAEIMSRRLGLLKYAIAQMG